MKAKTKRIAGQFAALESHVMSKCAHRTDVATTMKAEDVVGRSIRVYWPNEEAWFAGLVEEFEPSTGQHKVNTDRINLADIYLQMSGTIKSLGPGTPDTKKKLIGLVPGAMPIAL